MYTCGTTRGWTKEVEGVDSDGGGLFWLASPRLAPPHLASLGLALCRLPSTVTRGHHAPQHAKVSK